MFGIKALRDFIARRLQVPQMDLALEHLREREFEPRVVFDVGAHQGDFAKIVLDIWPRSDVACFEVQHAPLDRLRAISGSKVRVFECLLGSSVQEEVALHLCDTASSILQEQAVPLNEQANFPMETIDSIVAQHFGGEAPELVKIDTQGYELEILRGGEKSLPRIQVIIAEVNLLDLHVGVPLLHQVVEWLADRDWVAYDICGLTRRPIDRALWQADFVFVPEKSELRADKRW